MPVPQERSISQHLERKRLRFLSFTESSSIALLHDLRNVCYYTSPDCIKEQLQTWGADMRDHVLGQDRFYFHSAHLKQAKKHLWPCLKCYFAECLPSGAVFDHILCFNAPDHQGASADVPQTEGLPIMRGTEGPLLWLVCPGGQVRNTHSHKHSQKDL